MKTAPGLSRGDKARINFTGSFRLWRQDDELRGGHDKARRIRNRTYPIATLQDPSTFVLTGHKTVQVEISFDEFHALHFCGFMHFYKI